MSGSAQPDADRARAMSIAAKIQELGLRLELGEEVCRCSIPSRDRTLFEPLIDRYRAWSAAAACRLMRRPPLRNRPTVAAAMLLRPARWMRPCAAARAIGGGRSSICCRSFRAATASAGFTRFPR